MAKISKRDAIKLLAKVPEDYVFRCNDSCIMKDMQELMGALDGMTDETYAYHANESKNDFSNWVTDIIGDRELADSLRKANNRTEASRLVAERVAFLNRRAAQRS